MSLESTSTIEQEDSLYLLEIDTNQEGIEYDDPERAWSAFKECKTTCALIHRDDGMIAEKWLEDDDEGNIYLEEMIYDEQFEEVSVYA